MAMPMSAALQRGRVVHAVAGHRDDVRLALQHLDEAHLVLGRDARDHAHVADRASELVVGHRFELGAADRAPGDAELAGDRRGGDRVVAGDHAYLDAGLLARVAIAAFACGRGGSTIPTSASTCQPVEQAAAYRRRRVERAPIEVLAAGRQHTQALARRAARSPPGSGLELVVDRRDGVHRRGSTIAATERAAGRARPSRSSGRRRGRSSSVIWWNVAMSLYAASNGSSATRGKRLTRRERVDAALLGEHHERALGGVADQVRRPSRRRRRRAPSAARTARGRPPAGRRRA